MDRLRCGHSGIQEIVLEREKGRENSGVGLNSKFLQLFQVLIIIMVGPQSLGAHELFSELLSRGLQHSNYNGPILNKSLLKNPKKRRSSEKFSIINYIYFPNGSLTIISEDWEVIGWHRSSSLLLGSGQHSY